MRLNKHKLAELLSQAKPAINMIPVVGTFVLVLIIVLAKFGIDVDLQRQDHKTPLTRPRAPLALKVLTVLPAEEGKPMTPYGIMSLYIHGELSKFSNESFPVTRIETAGSFDTLIQIEQSDEPCIGLAQADVLYHYLHGGHPQFPLARNQSRVRAVCQLFDDWLFCFAKTVREPIPGIVSFPGTIREQRPDWIYTGTPGTGHLVTAHNVQHVLSLPWSEDDRTMLDESNKPGTYLRLQVISPAGANNFSTENGTGDTAWEPVYLENSSINVLENAFDGTYTAVRHERIQQALQAAEVTYAFPRKGQGTIAVPTILVANAEVSHDVIRQIKQVLQELYESGESNQKPILMSSRFHEPNLIIPVSAGQVRSQTGFPISFTGDASDNDLPFEQWWERASEGIPVATHRSVRRMKLPRVSRGLAEMPWLPRLFLGLLSTGFFAYLVSQFHQPWLEAGHLKFGPRALFALKTLLIRRGKPLWLAFAFAFTNVLVAVLIWVSEYNAETLDRDTVLSAGTLANSFAALADLILTGDYTPSLASPHSVFWLGLLKTGYAVTGIYATIKASKLLGGMMIDRQFNSQHIVVIGEGVATDRLLGELIAQEKAVVLVVQDKTTADRMPQDKRLEVQVCSTKIQEHLVSEATIQQADSILVRSDKLWSKADGIKDTDFWVARICAEIDAVLSKANSTEHATRPRVIAEISSTATEKIILNCGATPVCINELNTLLLSHVSSKPSFHQLIGELLHTSRNSNEIYFTTYHNHSSYQFSFQDVHAKLTSLAENDSLVALGWMTPSADRLPSETLAGSEDGAPLRLSDLMLIPRGHQLVPNNAEIVYISQQPVEGPLIFDDNDIPK